MKYRIKDPDVIKGFKSLGWTYEFDETEVERFGFYWHGDCRDRIFFNPHEEFEVEPVPELVKGGHVWSNEIVSLIDLLCDAASLADGISQSSDFGKADRRKFRALAMYLSETWFAISECYCKENDEEESEK